MSGSIFPKARLPTPFLRTPLTKKHIESGKGRGALDGCSYSLCSMQGWRVSQEDAHAYNLPTPRRKDLAFFGIFDGHGGNQASKYAAEHLLSFIENSDSFEHIFSAKSGEGIQAEILARATLEGFFNCDAAMHKSGGFATGQDMSGSTGVVCFVTEKNLVIGNTGDSRAVLTRNGQVVFASKDHKPKDEREKSRVESAGGFVVDGRINGDLASARSFGDFRYKTDLRLPASQQQVTVMPDVAIIDRDPKDQVLILACDGVWDVMSNLECAQFVLAVIKLGGSLQQAAELVLDECLRKSSGDNMSVLIISFNDFASATGKSKKANLDTAREKMYSAVL